MVEDLTSPGEGAWKSRRSEVLQRSDASSLRIVVALRSESDAASFERDVSASARQRVKVFRSAAFDDGLGSGFGSCRVVRRFPSFCMMVLECSSERALGVLRRDARVRFAHREGVYSVASMSWGLDRIDPPMDGVYRPSRNGSGVGVFVVDTGLDCGHAEWSGNCVNVFDAFSDCLSLNNDGHGHGTHCAGTVAGRSVGVSPGARVYGVKVLDDDGSGSSVSVLSGLEFIYTQYAAPAVISMSIGGLCDDITCAQDATVRVIDDYLVPAGFTVVVAAANDACDACTVSPAAARKAITVGATNAADRRASYSNFGACVDVYAPGSAITSACAGGNTLMSGYCNGDYLTISGTSMATPHVAGIVAQLLQWSEGSLTPAQMLSWVQDDGTYLASLDDDGGRPVLSTIPRSQPVASATSDNGYATPGAWICDKGYTGSSCTVSAPLLLTCTADRPDLLVAYAINQQSDDGWGQNDSLVVATYPALLPVMNGTLPCNYATDVQACAVGSVYVAAFCAPPSSWSHTYKELYVDPCASYMYGAYPGEYFTFEVNSADQSCAVYSDFHRLSDNAALARSLCPPELASFWDSATPTRAPTHAPTLAPTPAPSENASQSGDHAARGESHSDAESALLIALPTSLVLMCMLFALIDRLRRQRRDQESHLHMASLFKVRRLHAELKDDPEVPPRPLNDVTVL